MAKSKNPETTKPAEPVKYDDDDGMEYSIVGHVRTPTLKVVDGQSVVVKILQPIETKNTMSKDDKGNPIAKEIDVLRVCHLRTGEVMELVAGVALKSALLEYKGGNNAYVGLCYRLKKLPPLAGKRHKQWEIQEIAVKGE